MTFNNITKVTDIEQLKHEIANGHASVRLNDDALVTAVTVSDNAYLLYCHNSASAIMHDPCLHFAGVLLDGELYAKSSVPCLGNYRLPSFEVAMAKTKAEIVKAIHDLYDAAEVSPDAFAGYELPLAKTTAKQILVGITKFGEKIEPSLNDDEILPVLLGVASANEVAAAHIGDNGSFYAWHKAKEAKALELIERHEAGDDKWYEVFDAVTAASGETLTIQLKLNGRATTARITKKTFLGLLAEGDNVILKSHHFLGSCGITALQFLYGSTYNKQSELTLYNIVSISGD